MIPDTPNDYSYISPLQEGSVLYEICQRKLEHVEQKKHDLSEYQMMQHITRLPLPKDFVTALTRRVDLLQVGLIAEIKKASPSKGVIREDFDPKAIAKAYQEAGAACLSVLTDEPYFQGKDEYIHQVREASPLPILRKDFILDPYQVTESRYLGADCILLIMAALSDEQAQELEEKARALGMAVLIEVHTHEELQRAMRLTSRLIGINNRNLKTLEVDISMTEQLANYVTPDITLVCESGISTYDDILRMQEAGAHAFLVGESLMKQDDIYAATLQLLNLTPK